ncbi:MAG: hypothetical protein EOO88_40210 [Pedobacter sp.]|nr:MAG: hypothetical protein EOO88_40210 [Pedobacter sp.]
MKVHSTNYFDTFIEVAEDTKASSGIIPPVKEKRTVADLQFQLVSQNPYQYTSDDVFFKVFADRNDLTEAEYDEARAAFFSKGQPCFRASPLPKTYGFGIHNDDKGRVALIGMETEEYQKFIEDSNIRKLKAMKSGK